jgi:predicted Zn-dependent peptidase
MTVEITTLANGLRVVSHQMPHVETVSLGVWVASGARHETAAENGISHLLEHMAFKGTRRRTARAIAEEIEQVGGDLNAATSLETTAYYARVLRGDEAIALDILADILQNPSYAEEDLVKEREVILQEIAGISDSPEELAFDLVQEAAFPGQPVGRAIIGTPLTVSRITPDELRAFLADRYTAPRTVVGAAGAISHDKLVRHAEALFGGMSDRPGVVGEPAHYAGGRQSLDKSFEQAHLLIGFPSPSYLDEDFYATQVFSGLLGGGMSSRLFQEVRENRGLCYAIYATAWGLRDAGMLVVHAATGGEMMTELIDTIGAELKRAAREAPSVAEVDRAKAQIKVGLLMSLESTAARVEQIARQLLLSGHIVPTTELIQRIDAVTPEATRRIAARMIEQSKPAIAVVGAGDRSSAYARASEAALRV